MRATLHMVAVSALLVLGLQACVSKQADPRQKPLLRSVETPEEQLFIQCAGRDPTFSTVQCRRFRGPQRAGSDR